MKRELPKRGYPAKGVLISSCGPTLVIATVCTHHRVPWLANDLCHQTLESVWRDARAWLVGKYVVMPDHLHFFAAPGDQVIQFERWVGYWKSLATKALKEKAKGWQTKCWHHRLRSSESYGEKWDYIRFNPVRKGLVKVPEDWPYQGELNVLRW